MRFVYPATDTLTLETGDTLTVKRRLNIGETRESFLACSSLVRAHPEDPDDETYTRVVDPLLVGRARVAAFLIGWTSVDGAAPPLEGLDLAGRLAILDNLEPDDFYAIRTAIDTHEAQQSAARLEEKKRPSGANTADPISRSPSELAGVSTG
jgi:hypothetical protein